MITGIEPWRSWMRCSIPQPSMPGIITSSRISCGRLLALEHRHSLFGGAGLEHGVALELEARAHVLAHAVVVVDDEDGRAGLLPRARARSSRGTCRGRRGGTGDVRRACRRPGRGPGRTISGSCSARRRGTSRPGRGSASRARWRALGARGGRGRPQPLETTQSCRKIKLSYGFKVRMTVCLPPGCGLSCSASPSATPSTNASDDGCDGEHDAAPVAAPPRRLAPRAHGSKSIAPRA